MQCILEKIKGAAAVNAQAVSASSRECGVVLGSGRVGRGLVAREDLLRFIKSHMLERMIKNENRTLCWDSLDAMNLQPETETFKPSVFVSIVQ